MTENGVASQLNRSTKEETWLVKGPMGLGLDIKEEGHYVAFAGGTGILVFLDLVAFILIKIASGSQFESTFRFTLYFAAPNEEEAIGLKLCQNLH
jgi:NAD(P)H-flavin reductase